MSRTLEYRLEKALEYARVPSKHRSGAVRRSGGRRGDDRGGGPCTNISRPTASPNPRCFWEEQSASTYENLVYSKLLIQEREAKRRQTIRDVMAASGYLSPPDEEVSIRVGIITSNFHVLRAKAIARKTGIPGITGIAAQIRPGAVFTLLRPGMLRDPKR